MTHLDQNGPDQTGPPTPQSPPSPSRQTWWGRNRVALVLLVPLGALAALASSAPLFTLYLPSQFSRVQRGEGGAVHFRERFYSLEFDGVKRWYPRDVLITLKTLTSRSVIGDERAARGATLWQVTLEMQAQPDVQLRGCQVLLVDQEGRLYNNTDGKTGEPGANFGCTPADTPGPDTDGLGNLLPGEGTRPSRWTFQRTVAMPEGRQPQAVRVAWQPPNYAEIPAQTESRQ